MKSTIMRACLKHLMVDAALDLHSHTEELRLTESVTYFKPHLNISLKNVFKDQSKVVVFYSSHTMCLICLFSFFPLTLLHFDCIAHLNISLKGAIYIKCNIIVIIITRHILMP